MSNLFFWKLNNASVKTCNSDSKIKELPATLSDCSLHESEANKKFYAFIL